MDYNLFSITLTNCTI